MNEYPQDYGRGSAAPGGANASNVSTSMMTFVVGAAVGAGVALLLAPASGPETRRRLSQTARRLGTSVKDGVEQAREHMGELKDDVRSAVNSGREAFSRGRESRTDTPAPPKY